MKQDHGDEKLNQKEQERQIWRVVQDGFIPRRGLISPEHTKEYREDAHEDHLLPSMSVRNMRGGEEERTVSAADM